MIKFKREYFSSYNKLRCKKARGSRRSPARPYEAAARVAHAMRLTRVIRAKRIRAWSISALSETKFSHNSKKPSRKLKQWSYGRHKAVHAQWASMVLSQRTALRRKNPVQPLLKPKKATMSAAGANATCHPQAEGAGAHISLKQGSL